MKKTIPQAISKYSRHALFIALALTVLSPWARAQTGVYASFTAAKMDSTNSKWIYGPTVGAYFDSSHFAVLEWGADLRGTFLGGGGATQLQSGLVGPRVVVHAPIIPIKPYAEGLVGIGHGQVAGQASATKFQYEVLGGIEYTLVPRIDWRVVEVGYSSLTNFDGGLTPKTFSTGLVVRLPSF